MTTIIGCILALIVVGLPLALSIKYWLDCRWEAKRYREEHGLE